MLCLFLALMPAITVIDVRHRIIPNKLTYPSLIAFPVYIVAAWLFGADLDPVRAAIGFAAYGGGLFVVAVVSGGMGFGDVKLAGVIGVVLGALGLGYVGVAAGAALVLGGLGGILRPAPRTLPQGRDPVRAVHGGRRDGGGLLRRPARHRVSQPLPVIRRVSAPGPQSPRTPAERVGRDV